VCSRCEASFPTTEPYGRRCQARVVNRMTAPMLHTEHIGRELLHRHLWIIVEDQAKQALKLECDWFNPSLIAMVFAFYTVEAYLNFIGEHLAPDVWQDERNFFRREPYRGWTGKLRKVMELVQIPWSPDDRHLKTVLELKELRDLIAHGKSEKLGGSFDHAMDMIPPLPISTLRSRVTPKQKLSTSISHVEQFLDQIHTRAAAMVKDPWFGAQALRGSSTYGQSSTRPSSP
jgi:hypothetical protein